MKTIKQKKPKCKLRVCAECNQIRGYNQCKEDVLGLIDDYIKSKEDCCLKCKEELKERIGGNNNAKA